MLLRSAFHPQWCNNCRMDVCPEKSFISRKGAKKNEGDKEKPGESSPFLPLALPVVLSATFFQWRQQCLFESYFTAISFCCQIVSQDFIS